MIQVQAEQAGAAAIPVIIIDDNIHDAHRGELFGSVFARDKETDQRLSGIDYSVYGDSIFIKFVITVEPHRRKGLATSLINHLRNEYPGKKLTWSAVNDDGEAFAKAVDPSGAPQVINFNTHLKA